WLSDAGDALGQPVTQLSLGGALAAVALAGVLVLITGAPGTPLRQDGGRRLLLDRGRGVIHFSRSGSAAERLTTSTVAELVLDAGQAPAPLAERLLAPFDDEMRRYATVIRDPHNPVTRLRLVVGSPPAAHLLGGRARGILGADLDMIVIIDPVEV